MRRLHAAKTLSLIASAVQRPVQRRLNIDRFSHMKQRRYLHYRYYSHLKAVQQYISELHGGEPDMSITAANTSSRIASAYEDLQNYKEAEKFYQRAFAAYENTLGSDHKSTLVSMEWYQKQLTGYEKAIGENHPEILGVVRAIASIYEKLERYDELHEFYRKQLARYEKTMGENHPKTFDIALELYQKQLARYQKMMGEDHPETLGVVRTMASVYEKLERYEESLEYYCRALAGSKKLETDFCGMLDIIHAMKSLYLKLNRYDEALECHVRLKLARTDTDNSGHDDINISSPEDSDSELPKCLRAVTKSLPPRSLLALSKLNSLSQLSTISPTNFETKKIF
ncbi:hypothetical protein RUND412_007044 [Rhizina undulata]